MTATRLTRYVGVLENGAPMKVNIRKPPMMTAITTRPRSTWYAIVSLRAGLLPLAACTGSEASSMSRKACRTRLTRAVMMKREATTTSTVWRAAS